MHKYGIFTVLPFSKYANPIFAQRKPNRKLPLFLDLSKSKTLIANEDTNNIYPVRNLSVAAQHVAGESLFCKLECSLAYHCLQMADQRSLEMLGFSLFSRHFAYRRHAKGLSRFASVSLSFMRGYLDSVVKADQCAHYVDDNGIAANNATDTPETSAQSSNAFAEQDWNWHLISAFLESVKLNSEAKKFHPRDYHHKLTNFKTFKPTSDSSNRKSVCSASLSPSTFTQIILPGWMKNSTHSKNS